MALFTLLCFSGSIWGQNSSALKTSVSFKKYDTEHFNQVLHHKTVEADFNETVSFENSEWKVLVETQTVSNQPDAQDLTVRFTCTKGSLNDASVAVDLNFNNWSTDNYVLVPGALYNGNRYPWRRIPLFAKVARPTRHWS